MSALNINAITRLNSVAGVDLNVNGGVTILYNVPTGNNCIITSVVIRNASTSLTLASYSFGFNAASYNDNITNSTHIELTGNTLFTILPTKTGATKGISGGNFSIIVNTPQGVAATITIDIFGYLM